METKTRNGRILDERHETARGLHGAGLISKRRMAEFDILCHLDVQEMSPKQIKLVRQKWQVLAPAPPVLL